MQASIETVLALCRGYYWVIRGTGKIHNIPNPGISYPVGFPFETPLIFAANQLRTTNRAPPDLKHSIMQASEALLIPYEHAFDIELHSNWQTEERMRSGVTTCFHIWHTRFDESIRFSLETLC